MSVSVRDVLALKGLEQAKLLAGEAGLDREVLYITVGEEPDLPDWIFGGELILSTLFAIHPDKRSDHVKRLARSGSVGLFVKPERFIGELPEDVIQAADNVSLPLVKVPSNVLWSRLLATFYQVSLQEQIERAQVETEMRMRGGFVEEVLSGNLETGEIVQRARYLDCDFSEGGTVLIAAFRNPSDETDVSGGAERQFTMYKLYEVIETAACETTGDSISVLRDESVVLLLGGETDGVEVANRILSRCNERLQEPDIHVGVGRTRNAPQELLESYEEAAKALGIGKRLPESVGSIHEFEKLDMERLLFDLGTQDHSPLSRFKDETLGALLEYDDQHNTHLLQTLRVYIESDGNISEAAERLYAHRHTVRYRLRRVREITGLNVSSFEDAMRLFLAIKVASVT